MEFESFHRCCLDEYGTQFNFALLVDRAIIYPSICFDPLSVAQSLPTVPGRVQTQLRGPKSASKNDTISTWSKWHQAGQNSKGGQSWGPSFFSSVWRSLANEPRRPGHAPGITPLNLSSGFFAFRWTLMFFSDFWSRRPCAGHLSRPPQSILRPLIKTKGKSKPRRKKETIIVLRIITWASRTRSSSWLMDFWTDFFWKR